MNGSRLSCRKPIGICSRKTLFWKQDCLLLPIALSNAKWVYLPHFFLLFSIFSFPFYSPFSFTVSLGMLQNLQKVLQEVEEQKSFYLLFAQLFLPCQFFLFLDNFKNNNNKYTNNKNASFRNLRATFRFSIYSSCAIWHWSLHAAAWNSQPF